MSQVFTDVTINGHIQGTGIIIRKPVRAATVIHGDLSTEFVNGSVIDGVTYEAGTTIYFAPLGSKLYPAITYNATGTTLIISTLT